MISIKSNRQVKIVKSFNLQKSPSQKYMKQLKLKSSTSADERFVMEKAGKSSMRSVVGKMARKEY